MPLTKNQIRFLRGKCHACRPVVMLGQKGLTPAVLAELDIALNRHELVKIKIAAEDREALQLVIDELCEQSGAERVQVIGKMLCLFRRNTEKPVIKFPAE